MRDFPLEQFVFCFSTLIPLLEHLIACIIFFPHTTYNYTQKKDKGKEREKVSDPLYHFIDYTYFFFLILCFLFILVVSLFWFIEKKRLLRFLWKKSNSTVFNPTSISLFFNSTSDTCVISIFNSLYKLIICHFTTYHFLLFPIFVWKIKLNVLWFRKWLYFKHMLREMLIMTAYNLRTARSQCWLVCIGWFPWFCWFCIGQIISLSSNGDEFVYIDVHGLVWVHLLIHVWLYIKCSK